MFETCPKCKRASLSWDARAGAFLCLGLGCDYSRPAQSRPLAYLIWNPRWNDYQRRDGGSLYAFSDRDAAARECESLAAHSPGAEVVAMAPTDILGSHTGELASLVGRLGGTLAALVARVEAWGQDEDGIPDEVWGVYREALTLLGRDDPGRT